MIFVCLYIVDGFTLKVSAILVNSLGHVIQFIFYTYYEWPLRLL